MIYSTRLTTSSDQPVYTSTTTGAPVGGLVVGQVNAITTMIICNTGTPDPIDETVNSVTITINLCKAQSPTPVSTTTNRIISNLIVPAGETVFLSEERIVLDSGDQIRATASVGNLISITVSALPV
jgi:hypothetical protein